jgi:hypothetical protein
MKCGFELQDTGIVVSVAGLGRNIIKKEPGVGINTFKEDSGAIFHSGTQRPDRGFSIRMVARE